MATSFIQYLLMMPPKNMNLDKARFKNLINFKFKFQYILFYTFHFYKKIKGSEILIDQDTDKTYTIFLFLFKISLANLF